MVRTLIGSLSPSSKTGFGTVFPFATRATGAVVTPFVWGFLVCALVVGCVGAGGGSALAGVRAAVARVTLVGAAILETVLVALRVDMTKNAEDG